MASEVNHHVGYSRENECWFVRFYPYQTEQQASEAAAAFTRPAPAATDTGLETWKFHAPVNGSAKMIQSDNGEWVPRSQAEDIIRDLETKILEAAISDRLDDAGSPLSWQERAEKAEADLAAERAAQQRLLDIIEEANDDKEALEAKLAAAEKALETYKSAVKSVCESQRGTKWGKVAECIFDAIERAVLGGEP